MSLEIEHTEEVESVKENLLLLSDEEYPADFEEAEHSKSPEFKRFVQQSEFLKEMNESLTETPHFLFDKFMSALKVQQENYNRLINKIDLLEDQMRQQQSTSTSKIEQLENRIKYLESESVKAVNPPQFQDAMKRLELICSTTVNGVNDVMHYIKSQQSSQVNLNQGFDRPFSASSQKSFLQVEREQYPSHKSEMFSDLNSESSTKQHHVGNDWSIKTPTKPSRAASNVSSSINSEQRSVLQSLLRKYVAERRQLEDKLTNSTLSEKSKNVSQLSLLDKHITDLKGQIEKL